MNPTRNDMPEKVRQQACELLAPALAEAIHLHLQAKEAHWNVKGKDFYQLHELFDKVADAAHAWSDDLAERITALGGTAEGNPPVLVQRSKLPPNPTSSSAAREHIAAIADSLAAFGKRCRDGIARTADGGDAGTSDLFTEIVRESDKNLWFVESHLQGE